MLSPPSLVIEGCLEEGTETPFGWEEGKLVKKGTYFPLRQEDGCWGEMVGSESPGGDMVLGFSEG